MLESIQVESLAVQRRRESRREEWEEHTRLAGLLIEYLDPGTTFWTSLENKPLSPVSGMFQKLRGVRSGLPDVVVLHRHGTSTIVIFIELKSRRGKVSHTQKQVRAEMLPANAKWWLARTARAALMALHLSGVVFRRKWRLPRLDPWEGPFADPTQPMPVPPDVAAEWRDGRRWRRARQRERIAAARSRADADGGAAVHATPSDEAGSCRSGGVISA
jgi:hypothetical protein